MLKLAVIGHPVAHSLSPTMHRANLHALGLEGSYEKLDVAPEGLGEAVRRFRDEGYAGLNVTIPHKQAVIPLLDHVDLSVARYGACNTLKFEPDGTLTGFNTDVIGFGETLSAHGFSLKSARVTVAGCGGAGGALAAYAAYEGAARVAVAGRSADKVGAVVARLRGLGLASEIVGLTLGSPDCLREARASDLVVNATPLGLKPGDDAPLPAAAFRPGQFAFDIIPTRARPPMAKVAAAAGAVALDGLEFLVGQGAKSFELWTGRVADRAVMMASLREVIFLYGPPASGKSTLGRKVAAQRGAAFVDLDDEIVRRERCTIPAIFAARGEPGFRDAESAALAATIASVAGPTVIALGGGTLLRDANRRLCEAVGKVYCLQAPSAAELTRRIGLAAGSRPLGDKAKERAAHYASFPLQVDAERALDEIGLA